MFHGAPILFGLMFVLTVIAPAQDEEASRGGAALRALLENYRADRALIERRHDRPMSSERLGRLDRLLGDYAAALDGVDFEALDRSAQVDWLLLRNRLDQDRARLGHEEKRWRELDRFLPFAAELLVVTRGPLDLDTLDPEKTAQRLDALRKSVAALRRSLPEATPALRRRARRMVDDFRGALERWFRFYEDYDPITTWWCRKPTERLVDELRGYAGDLRNQDGDDDLIGDPIGAAALADELAFEFIPYTPEELVAIAEGEFAWCDAEMAKAAKELGFEDWREAQDEVKRRHVEPGKQPELIRELALEAIAFLEERDLVTIPALCKEGWRMTMLSPERQKTSPYFLGGETIQVAYPTDDMDHADKLMSMRGNNRHFARATVQHELIPGHHLQGYMNERHRPWRRAYRTPFWVEGWALYWEMRLWDLEFPRSAEDRIGMLFWRKHRCARIVFSLSYQLGTMSAEECVDYLVERVGHERNNAEAEVRRSIAGNYGPLYQAAYMLGGLQFRALHREFVASGKMSERAFHDAVLERGPIPVALLRLELGDETIDRDAPKPWRFAAD